MARFAPIAALVFVTNMWVDPATGLRRGVFEDLAAQQLLAGRAVRRSDNDRSLQTIYLERASSPVDVLVLGSSRSMPIGTRQVAGRTLWNASVSAAWLEELAVIYLKAKSSRLAPRSVLLGLDHWHLLRAKEATRFWLAAELGNAERELGVPLLPAAEATLLRWTAPLQPFSLADFQRGLARGATQIWHRRFYPRPSDVVAAPGELGRVMLRRPDGSIAFPPRTRAAELTSRDEPGASEPDAMRLRILEALVARIRADGRGVVLVLPPYRAGFAERTGLRQRLARAEAEVRLRARSWGVPLLGSFDPVASGCSFEEFHDDTHPAEACFERLLPRPLPLSAGSR